jgi:hypothetical protein
MKYFVGCRLRVQTKSPIGSKVRSMDRSVSLESINWQTQDSGWPKRAYFVDMAVRAGPNVAGSNAGIIKEQAK